MVVHPQWACGGSLAKYCGCGTVGTPVARCFPSTNWRRPKLEKVRWFVTRRLLGGWSVDSSGYGGFWGKGSILSETQILRNLRNSDLIFASNLRNLILRNLRGSGSALMRVTSLTPPKWEASIWSSKVFIGIAHKMKADLGPWSSKKVRTPACASSVIV